MRENQINPKNNNLKNPQRRLWVRLRKLGSRNKLQKRYQNKSKINQEQAKQNLNKVRTIKLVKLQKYNKFQRIKFDENLSYPNNYKKLLIQNQNKH